MSRDPDKSLVCGKRSDNLIHLSPQKEYIPFGATEPQKVEDKLPIFSPGISIFKIFICWSLFLKIYSFFSFINTTISLFSLSLPDNKNHLERLTEIGFWGTSLEVQQLSLCASNAGGIVLTPGQGTMFPHAAVKPKKKKEKRFLNKFLRERPGILHS